MSRRARTAVTLRECPVISERQRTTAIAGGPASGKTGLVIERLIDRIAPMGGPALSPSRLLVMTGRPETARDFARRLGAALRRAGLAGVEVDLDEALIAGGREVDRALLAAIGRADGDLSALLAVDREAREALADRFDHIVVDDVDDTGDRRVAIAAMLARPGELTIAGEAAGAAETGDERVVVRLDDRSRAPVASAAETAEMVADLVARAGLRCWSEIAIAAGAPALEELMAQLDAAGVPVSDHAGALLRSPRMRQLLLAICAIAEPGDAVAAAALYAPPMFAIGPADRSASTARFVQAEATIAGLRVRRHHRPAGETVRALISASGCARHRALGPSGAIGLARLERLCEAVDELAGTGLDFDAVAAVLRRWADDPPPIDCPAPTGVDAVQLRRAGELSGTADLIYAWRVDEHAQVGLARRAEAALIVCPPIDRTPLLDPPPPAAPDSPVTLLDGQPLADAVSRAWKRIEPEARARHLPSATIAAATPPGSRGRRFDPLFGDTVRHALGACLERGVSIPAAITAAALDTGLESFLGAATEDLERALDRLDQLGAPSIVRFAYPIAGTGPGGELLTGSVDLVAEIAGELWAIDVITDAPPEPGFAHVDRLERLRLAATLIARAQTPGRPVRAALLYTADGSLHELDSRPRRQTLRG